LRLCSFLGGGIIFLNKKVYLKKTTKLKGTRDEKGEYESVRMERESMKL